MNIELTICELMLIFWKVLILEENRYLLIYLFILIYPISLNMLQSCTEYAWKHYMEVVISGFPL